MDSDNDWERRRDERADLEMFADFREPGRTRFRVRTIDISRTGARIETLYRAEPGTHVWLTVADLAPIESIIRWVTRDMCGVQFLQPLHPSVFEHIKQKFPNSWR